MPREGCPARRARASVAQEPLVAEHRGIHHDLADVVEEGREVDVAPLLVAQAELPRHHVDEGGHRPRVAGVVHVGGFEEGHQHLAGVGEEVDRPLLEPGARHRHRGVAGETLGELGGEGREALRLTPGEAQGPAHLAVAQGNAEEAG